MNFLSQVIQKLSSDCYTYRETRPKLYNTPPRGGRICRCIFGCILASFTADSPSSSCSV